MPTWCGRLKIHCVGKSVGSPPHLIHHITTKICLFSCSAQYLKEEEEEEDITELLLLCMA